MASLGADLQPAGWRLTDASGIDHRRARWLLAQDLDGLEEQADGLRRRVQDPGRRAVDPRRDRGEAARRQGAQRPRRPARAGAGAGRGRARPRRRRAPPAARSRPAGRAGRRADAARACSAARCRPPPASAGTGPCTRRRRPSRWAGCSARSPRRAPSRWVHSCAPETPLALLRGAGARGLSVDLDQLARARPRRARRGAGRRGSRRARGRARRPSRPPRPTDAGLTERVLRWLDMLGLDHEIGRVPGRLGDLRPGGREPSLVTPGADPGPCGGSELVLISIRASDSWLRSDPGPTRSPARIHAFASSGAEREMSRAPQGAP